MYRFLFLDLDNTLLDFDAAEEVAICKAYRQLGIEPTPPLLRRYREINNAEWERFERGETSRDALLVERHELLFREWGIDKSATACEAAYRAYLGIGHYFIPGAPELLSYLSKKPYLLYLASNGVADTQDSRLDSAGIRPYFQDIFISETTGSYKPERAYFDYCFARIPGFDPGKALLIGDSLGSDILGGIQAGIDTCWFNPRGKIAPPALKPTYEIQALAQLQELL